MDAGEARRLFWYNRQTGDFIRRVTTASRAKAGMKAGGLDAHGYWVIQVGDQTHKAHRLAWLYVTGRWPEVEIDHRNRNRSDNRWINLREATKAQNLANGMWSTNTSGRKGVCFHKVTGKWAANIRIGGRQKWLGTYDTVEAAHAAYAAVARAERGEFARSA